MSSVISQHLYVGSQGQSALSLYSTLWPPFWVHLYCHHTMGWWDWDKEHG